MMPNPYQRSNDNSIIVGGVVLIVWECIVLCMYFFLSDPILSVLEGIFNLSTLSQMGTYSPVIIIIFNVIFAVAFITPVVWFFVWLFKKEGGYQFRRFY